MPTLFAEGTEVTVERSRAEIQRIVEKYGATGFASGYDGTREVVTFKANERFVRFDMARPSPADAPGGRDRERWAAGEHRRRWRCMAISIKSKLDMVASGITSFEDEFLAHIVMPDQRTVSTWLRPQLASAYKSGDMPPLLPGLGGTGGGR